MSLSKMQRGITGLLRNVAERLSLRSSDAEHRQDADGSESSQRLIEVLSVAQNGGFSLQCDFARINAGYVAMAASMGLITTEQGRGMYGRKWFATRKGKAWLEVHQ